MATPLFMEKQIGNLFGQWLDRIVQEVQHLPLSSLDDDKVDALADDMEQRITRQQAPVLLEDQVEVTQQEIQLPGARPGLGGRMVQYTGTEVTFHVPYKGDAVFFRICPTVHGVNPTLATSIEPELSLTYVLQPQSEVTKNQFRQDLQRVRLELERLQTDLDGFKGTIRQKIVQLLQQRRQALVQAQKQVDGLGYPVRKS